MKCVRTLVTSLVFITLLGQTYGQVKTSVTVPVCGTAMATPSIAGQSVTVQSPTTASVTLSWTSAVGSSYATQYKVSTAASFTAGCSAGTNVLTCTDNGLLLGNTYQFRVIATRFCRAGTETSSESKTSDVSTLTLQPPSIASISASSVTPNSFVLTWSAANGATSYQIDVANNSGFSSPASSSVGGTSTTISGLSASTTYYFRVRAANGGGTSPYISSSVATLQPVPPVPANLTASSVTQTSFTLSWSASAATGYRVDAAASSAYGSGVIYSNFATTATSLAFTGLTPGVSYDIKVRAVNGSGTSGDAAFTVRMVPAVPTVAGATNITAGGFTAQWQTAGVVDHFYVDISQSSDFSSLVRSNVDAGTATSLPIAGLTSITNYYFRVRGSNTAGTSTNSVASSAVFTLPSTPVPYADQVDGNSFLAKCNEVPGVNSYFFEVSDELSFSTLIPTCNGRIAAPSRVYFVGGVAGGTYYLRARAAFNSVLSDYSQPVQVDVPIGSLQTGTGGSSDSPFKVNIIPPSPEAAALAKYADVPVSLYSGTPSISVPLYELKQGTLSLPVSLSYNASGNKVESAATWVGLGWSLSAGGAVTRVVRGGWPDEHPRGFLDFAAQYHSFQGVNNLSNVDKARLYQAMAEGCRDGEPDLFYFNFSGYSGQFMFDWNGQIKLLSGNNIKIEPIGLRIPSEYDHFIEGWRFITDNGTRYEFGIDAIETTQVLKSPYNAGAICNYLQQINQSLMPQAWYLRDIHSANSFDWITFEYQGYAVVTESNASEERQYDAGIVDQGNQGRTLITTATHVLHLKKITTSSGLTTVNFALSTAKRTDQHPDSFDFPLANVEVKDINDRQIRRWDFDYNYNTNRLTLAKATERAGSLVKPPFIFEYDIPLPAPTSLSIDHWGFFNNNGAGTLIPGDRIQQLLPPYQFINITGADRTPNANKVLAGMLTQITYPTGGKDVFDFESHDYSFEQNSPLLIPEQLTHQQRDLAVLITNNNPEDTIIFRARNAPMEIRMSYEFTYRIPFNGRQTRLTITNESGQLVYDLALGNPLNGCDGTTPEVLGCVRDTETVTINSPGRYVVKLEGSIAQQGTTTLMNSGFVDIDWDEPSVSTIPEIRKGGGVRVKRITRSFGNGNPDQVTRYDYTFEEDGQRKSSGSLLESGYIYGIWRTAFVTLGGDVDPVDRLVRFSQNKAAFGTTQGSHVGYSHVTVFHGENGENGTTKYRYDSPREIQDFNTFEVPFPPSMSVDHSRGLLLEQNDFDATGLQAVHSVENAYKYFTDDVLGLKIGWALAISGSNIEDGRLDYYAVGLYTNRPGYTRLKQTKERLIKDGTAFETVQKFEYAENTHKQLVKAWTANSKGDSIVTSMKYPLDYASPGAAIQKMKDLHIYSVPLEKLTWRKEAGSQVNLLSGSKTDFAIIGSSVVPSIMYSARITNPILTSDAYGTIAGLYEPRATLKNYDRDNPTEVSEVDGRNTSYLYGYQRMLPVARVDNASIGQIFYEGFEDAITAEKKAGQGSRQISGGAYTLPDLGRPSVNGNYILSWWTKTGSSPWAYNERLIQNYVAGTSIATDVVNGFIDEVRLYPQGAFMTTLTYDPLVGVTSTTDPANRTAYYEYDDFGRLKFIRDQDRNIVQSHDYQFIANVGYQTPAPDITTFSPITGVVGSSVTISGTNFGANAAYNDVKLNGVSADIISATATQLIVRVPVGATSGKLTVTVNNNSASSSKDFTVTNP